MATDRVIVIGAGVGGLASAIRLAARGARVTVLERASGPGGKMRTADGIDCGPTVFTMRWVFDSLFAETGAPLDEALALTPLRILARHAWSERERLDLHADPAETEAAIGAFAGAREAAGYRAFRAEAARMFATLDAPFLQAPRPNPISLSLRIGLHRLHDLLAIRPFETMWSALKQHFRDPRLVQLFGRFATYCGAAPMQAPATLMLIAHVEERGVWSVDGGMQRLADALAARARALGVTIRYDAEVAALDVRGGQARGALLASGERIEADAIVCNADPHALATGVFGAEARRAARAYRPDARSLSAMTWAVRARVRDFPLARHTVFFSRDYEAEFAAIARGQMLDPPTTYVCAQDRVDDTNAPDEERLFFLINARADGDGPDRALEPEECRARMNAHLTRCGFNFEPTRTPIHTGPRAFNALFPATGGALYGRASHGWMASFQRPQARTPIRGLYLAGGATHPGPGVPMAALSGMLAAQALMRDRASTRTFSPAAMPGGMSTRKATTGDMA